MNSDTFATFAAAIRNFNGDVRHSSLLMAQDGPVSVFYAPFEWVNRTARVVIVGITPGETQARNALEEARRAVAQGDSVENVLMRAKRTGAFSGSMRPSLVNMLNHIGLADRLGLKTCDELFSTASHLLQTASVLPFPVFADGKNYNGKPDMLRSPLLQRFLKDHFAPLARSLSGAVFVPVGQEPVKALRWLQEHGDLAEVRLLEGLPHPSGANAERIAYFLGRKAAATLSPKTNARKLDAAKATLMQAVAAMSAA